MFKLIKLEAENFKAYRQLSVPNINTLGLTLIKGDNGAGKSSIRALIEYLLTDTTSDSTDLSELSYNKEGNCMMYCSLIRESDNALIEIRKYRDHKEHGNKTFLGIDGNFEKLTTTDRRETQKNINELLNITRNILPISTIFSQKSASFPEATESEKKDILYDAKNLHKYSNWLDNVSNFISSYEKEIKTLETETSIKISDLEDIKESVKNLQIEETKFDTDKTETINRIQSSISFDKNQLANLNNKLSDLNEKLKSLNVDKIKEKEHQIDQLKISILGSDNAIEAYQESLKTLHEYKSIKLSDIRAKLKKLKSQLKTLGTTTELTRILFKKEREVFKKGSKLDNLTRKKNNLETNRCPILKISCDELKNANETILKTTDTDIHNLSNTILDLKSDIKTISDNLDLISKTQHQIDIHEDTLDKIQRYNKDNKELKLEKIERVDVQKKLDTLIAENEDDIKTFKDTALEREVTYHDIYSLEESIEKQTDSLNRAVDLKNNITPILDREKAKLSKYKKEIKEKNKTLAKTKEIIEYYYFWKIGFSKAGIPNIIIDSFLSEIENETNQNISKLSDQYYVQITNQKALKNSTEVREKVNYEVIKTNSNITDFNSYSGGQKQRIKLSDKIAFNKLLSNFNFMMLDEVLEISLDLDGKNQVLDLLKEISNDIGTILVISHDINIADNFDNVLDITMVNGESKIRGY